jgi:FlaA1/EpsC-like NDP-sugar epimerase
LGVWVSIGVAIIVAFVFSTINYVLGLGRVAWRKARPAYVIDLAFSSGITTLILFVIDRFLLIRPLLPPGLILVAGLFSFLGFTILRFRERLLTGLATRWVNLRGKVSILGERVLIVGAGECGQLAAWLLQKSQASPAYAVVGMVDDDPSKQRMNIDGHTVLGTTRDIPALAQKLDIGLILFAISRIDGNEQKRILDLCNQTTARVIIIPDLIQTLQNLLIK